MSSSDDSVVAVRIIYVAKKDFDCEEGSTYSYRINDEALFSTSGPQCAGVQNNPYPTSQPVTMLETTQHPQSNSSSTNPSPPGPIDRIVSRQATASKPMVNNEALNKSSSKSSIVASNRSSLSCDDEPALDDKTRQTHIRFTPPTSIIFTPEELCDLDALGHHRKDSSIKAPRPCYPKSPFPSFGTDRSGSEAQLKLEDIRLQPPPDQKDTEVDTRSPSHSPKELRTADHSELSVFDCQSRSKEAQASLSPPMLNGYDFRQAYGVAASDENSPESPCSSLLDLYLEPSHQSSFISTKDAVTERTMEDHSSSSHRTHSPPHSKNNDLRSPAQKIKSWVSNQVRRISTVDGRRATSDPIYAHFEQPAEQRNNARRNNWKVETDGYTSLTASDVALKKHAYRTSSEDISPGPALKGPKVLHRTYSTVLDGSKLMKSSHSGSSQKSPRTKVTIPTSKNAYERLRISQQSAGHGNGSRLSKKADRNEELEEMELQPPRSDGNKPSPIFSNSISEYYRMPNGVSNYDSLHSSRSKRAGSETDELLVGESMDDIELDNFIGLSNSPHTVSDKAEGGASATRRTLQKGSIKTENNYERNSPRSIQAESLMPGTFPLEGRKDLKGTEISQAAARPRASMEAPSGFTKSTIPTVRTRAKQVVIPEHKPPHERVRFPEPFFVPAPMAGAGQPDPGAEHNRHSKDATASTDSDEAKRMRDNVRMNVKPEIQPRTSSSISHLHSAANTHTRALRHVESHGSWETDGGAYVVEFPRSQDAGIELHSFDGEASWPKTHDGSKGYDGPGEPWVTADTIAERADSPAQQDPLVNPPKQNYGLRSDAAEKRELREFQKGHRRHHSFRGRIQASLHRAQRKGVLARDWDPAEKKCTAIIACASTALIGLIVGVYAGQVPAIQYAIVDEHTHYAILGNVFFYLGLAITTILAWPLPLLYGRKRLTLSGMAILLVLQFPQALVVSQQRTPLVSTYRVGLLLPRFVSGLAAGLAHINLWPTLLDVYGSSLQRQNPHQELIDENDPRRHGGGMGIWLGIWTWCHIGSIGLGFVIGAVIIGYLNVAWGFWVVIFTTLVIILLNVIAPETRPVVFRKSMAEVRKGADVSRRVGRGELMMHLYSTGPLHWWEEVSAGIVLNFRMIKQSGFIIMTFYQGWIYGQVVMIMILLGALASRYYYLRPQYVASCVAAFPIGALLAVPFQKASIFSRSRHRAQRTDSMTFEKRVTWSSHLVRRTVFMAALPIVAIAYTLSSIGPPLTIGLPCLFAAFIGFLTNLALSECYGLIMETFDTSDLQPGMTGRLRKELSEDVMRQRTNFSCYPRVTAGFSIVQTVSFIIAAIATAVGGNVERARGVQMATAFVAAVLIGLTLLLIGALTRFRTVQIVPTNRVGTAELSGAGDDLPVIIGHPSGTTRRISLLELGSMTRWTEIRRRNKLLGSGRHGKYP